MRARGIRIRNFRCIEDLAISFDLITRFIGGNGAGKSTVLRALEYFYARGTPNISTSDFFDHDTKREIEIAIIFGDFNEAEKNSFGPKIDENEEMIVARVFWANASKNNGLYFGAAYRNPHFQKIRAATKKTDMRELYKAMQEELSELPPVSRAEEIEDHLLAWEQEHPDQCELGRDDGRFFGFTNVAAGKLQEATSFVFIPAVRDASVDASEGKGSVISELLDLVVRSAVEARDDIRELQNEFNERYQQAIAPENLTELSTLQTALSATLQSYYENTSVVMNWKEAEPLKLPLPSAIMDLLDEGFKTPVDRTGHGLQRALVFTLLQHLAVASAPNIDEQANEANSADDEENSQAGLVSGILPGLILAIEEPELYQHPTKQRHLANVLEKLAAGTLQGVASETQVIFATHSPLFVSIDRFDELRIVGRQSVDGETVRQTYVNSASLKEAVTLLESAMERPAGTFSANTLRPRLHIIDSTVAEGFFSRLSVLVEGVSDRAALMAIAAIKGVNFEEKEISLIPVHGKSKIDKIAAIKKCLGVPVYLIWDNDNDAGDDQWANLPLQKLCDESSDNLDPSITRVSDLYACFKDKLETTLREEIGADLMDGLIDKHKESFEVSSRKDAQKTPEIMTAILQDAYEAGARSATLEGIIEKIIELWNGDSRVQVTDAPS